MKSKKLKRLEAQERQARYDALSHMSKWALTLERPGKSARERKRLGDETSPHKHPFAEVES